MIALRVAVARPTDAAVAVRLPWWGSVMWLVGDKVPVPGTFDILYQPMVLSPGGTNLLGKS